MDDSSEGSLTVSYSQLEILRHCLPSSVRRFLEELPESLERSNARIFQICIVISEVYHCTYQYDKNLLFRLVLHAEMPFATIYVRRRLYREVCILQSRFRYQSVGLDLGSPQLRYHRQQFTVVGASSTDFLVSYRKRPVYSHSFV